MVRVAGKGLNVRRLTVEGLKLKEEESERPRLLSGTAEWRDRWVAGQHEDFNAEGTEFTEVGGSGK